MIGKLKTKVLLEGRDFFSTGSLLARKEDGSDLKDANFILKRGNEFGTFVLYLLRNRKLKSKKHSEELSTSIPSQTLKSSRFVVD